MTLTATNGHEPVGALALGIDRPMPLVAEVTFPGEVAQLRAQGHGLCDFVKLAVDPCEDGKAILAALFHVAYIVAFRILERDRLVIVVNPRHVRFYQRLLGATLIASGGHNAGVNAPSVLLGLNLRHVERMIATLGRGGRCQSTELKQDAVAYML